MNLHAKRHNDYVVVDFDNVTEKGLKKLTDALNRSGANVSQVDANNRKMRRDTLFVKQAKLYFENGQNIGLFIGDQGDIYQLSLNGKKQPVPEAKNERELAKKLSGMLEKNQVKFDKSQLRKLAKPKVTGGKPLSRGLSARAKESADNLKTLEGSQQKVNSALESASDQLSDKNSQLAQLQQVLESEKQESQQLERELKQAKIDAGLESVEQI